MLSFTEAPTLTAPQTMEAALAALLEAALALKPKPIVNDRWLTGYKPMLTKRHQGFKSHHYNIPIILHKSGGSNNRYVVRLELEPLMSFCKHRLVTTRPSVATDVLT